MLLEVTLENGKMLVFEDHDDLYLYRVIEANVSWLDMERYAYLSLAEPKIGQELRLSVFVRDGLDKNKLHRVSGTPAVASPNPVSSLRFV